MAMGDAVEDEAASIIHMHQTPNSSDLKPSARLYSILPESGGLCFIFKHNFLCSRAALSDPRMSLSNSNRARGPLDMGIAYKPIN